MNSSQDFNQLYRDVSENMTSAMADLADLKVDNKEGQERLFSINNKLREIQADFDEELEFLEENAEWEKFTMAFFGETNAGKSTIIESLRILFNEESRQNLLDEGQGDLEKFSEEVELHADKVKTQLSQFYHLYTAEIMSIRHEATQLADILRQEADARLRLGEKSAVVEADILRKEVKARLELEKEKAAKEADILRKEGDSRLKLEEERIAAEEDILRKESKARVQVVENQASAKFMRKLTFVGLAAAGTGAGVAALSFMLLGG